MVLVMRAWSPSASYPETRRDLLDAIQRKLDTTDLSLPRPDGEPAEADVKRAAAESSPAQRAHPLAPTRP